MGCGVASFSLKLSGYAPETRHGSRRLSARHGGTSNPPPASKDEGLGLGCRAKINQPPFRASLLLFFFFLLLL